jgi:hypothetical protein
MTKLNAVLMEVWAMGYGHMRSGWCFAHLCLRISGAWRRLVQAETKSTTHEGVGCVERHAAEPCSGFSGDGRA